MVNSFLNMKNNLPVNQTPFIDIAGWWRADNYYGSAGSYYLTDMSGNSNPMSQVSGTLTPGIAANGKAKMTASGVVLNSNLACNNWPLTVITIGKRASGAVTGFFSSQTSPASLNIWFGYEVSNALNTYINSNITNTTSEYGNDAVYMVRSGYGGAVNTVNGIIQPNLGSFNTPMTLTPWKCTIGSTYRTLNIDWYETLVWNRELSISEIDFVNNYLNQRYSLSTPFFSSYAPVTTIAFAGQSNSDGRGRRGTGDVNIPSKYENLNTSVFDSNSNSLPPSYFANMNLSANIYFNPSYIGQELSASQDYAALTGKIIYVLKCSQGSTSMTQNPTLTGWGNNGYWSQNHNTNQNDSFSKFSLFFAYWWLILANLQSSGKTITANSFKGLTFFQGEDDAVNATAAGQWSSVAQSMFAALRQTIGLPKARILLVRINSQISLAVQPYRDTVRAQQDLAASLIPNCTEVSCDAWTPYDGVHLDYDGQLGLGSLLATLY